MGGDHYPTAPIQGALLAAAQLPADVQVVLVGKPDEIAQALEAEQVAADKFEILAASEVIEMHDSASRALMSKPNASIPIGIGAVKENKLDAFVSAGNTGAMLGCALFGLGPMPGLQRPTIGALFPVRGKYAFLCDVGANTDAKPEALAQFGLLGSVFMQAVKGIEKPRVALLNVGEEPGKGNNAAKEAYPLLEQNEHLNFVGNAEGWDLHDDKADVYVCDGFVGNLLLKFTEGWHPVLADRLPDDPEIAALDYARIGGLPFLGVEGLVLVGHGKSSPQAFHSMILRAHEYLQADLVNQIRQTLATANDGEAPSA